MAELQDASIRVLGFEQRFEYNAETGKHDRAEDWCIYAPTSDIQGSQNEDAIRRLKPSFEKLAGNEENRNMRHAFMENRWRMIEPAYNAWKSGHELPESGTPLQAWPGINAHQANALRMAGIRSVEDIAEMTENGMAKVQMPGVRSIVQQAKAFLEAADQSVTSHRMVQLEEQNKALSERLEAAIEMLESRDAQPAEDAPKKRGRPPKVKTDEAEAA